jgi:hypothetical protein
MNTGKASLTAKPFRFSIYTFFNPDIIVAVPLQAKQYLFHS